MTIDSTIAAASAATATTAQIVCGALSLGVWATIAGIHTVKCINAKSDDERIMRIGIVVLAALSTALVATWYAGTLTGIAPLAITGAVLSIICMLATSALITYCEQKYPQPLF